MKTNKALQEKRRIKRNQEVEKAGQEFKNPRKKTEEDLNTKNNQKYREITKSLKP